MTQLPTLHDRLRASADARSALIARFKPRTTVQDPNFEQRASLRAVELHRVREDRAAAKAAKVQANVQARQDALDADAAQAQAVLDAKRGERKARKALTKAEAKVKRDERYAARKARQMAPRRAAAHAA